MNNSKYSTTCRRCNTGANTTIYKQLFKTQEWHVRAECECGAIWFLSRAQFFREDLPIKTGRKQKKPEPWVYVLPKVDPKEIYNTRQWKILRYQVISMYGSRCMACNAVDKQIQVDHIRPVSLYPELALDPKNLQILCKDCNEGKINLDQKDFRTKKQRKSMARFELQNIKTSWDKE
jgi:5-methylcytosine-specific restriction endonuclease McrA